MSRAGGVSTGGLLALGLLLAAVVVGGLYFFGAMGGPDTRPAKKEVTPESKTASAPQVKIIKALIDFAAAQKIHKTKYGKYARHPELLIGLGRVDRTTGLSISHVLTYEGYYFSGLKKQAQGYVNLEEGFVLAATPAEYGLSGRDTYVVGPTAKVFRKDIGAEPISDAAQIDGSWSQVKQP
ncbi:MAG: DUF2950 family protein [Thermodesulfobacteriota bacterium]|nr:DUF2950 family protein [Thermodesulfobacteriota bacterium]